MTMKIYRIKQILKGLGQRKIGGEEGLVKNKAALFEFMERYPVRKMEVDRQEIKGGGLILTLKPMPIIVGIIIATLLTGGGTAYASQSSLPGDALYSVKLMTEDVESAVTWSPEKKVDMEAKFANRRLEEIKNLQEKIKNKKGEIPSGVVEKAMERAAKRLEKAEERITEMEDGKLKDKALKAASRFEEALQNHEQLLSDLAGEVPDEAEESLLAAQAKAALHAERAIGTIIRLEKVQEVGKKIKERAGERKIAGAEERAEGKLGALENKLEAAENYLENLKEQGKDVSGYEAKLDEARQKLNEAKNLLLEDKYLEAFQAASQVMKMLMEAKGVLRPIIMPRPMPIEGPLPVAPTLAPNDTAPLPTEPTILPVPEPNEAGEPEDSVTAPAPVEPIQAAVPLNVPLY